MNGIILSWTNPSPDDLASCELYRLEGEDAPTHREENGLLATIDPAWPSNDESYEDSDVIDGLTYSYSVFCADLDDNWYETVEAGNSLTVTYWSYRPENPMGLAASSDEHRRSTIWFSMPPPPVDGCALYRSLADYPGREGALLAMSSGTGVKQTTDLALNNGVTYYYAVYCHDGTYTASTTSPTTAGWMDATASIDGQMLENRVSIHFSSPIIGTLTAAAPGQFADGFLANSCHQYRYPPEGYLYTGSTGDGIYLIDPDDLGLLDPFPVFCDMSTDGGGWIAIVANGDNTVMETLEADDCYPLITNDPARGCGDNTNLMEDFTLRGDRQAALAWRYLLAIAYGDEGYTVKLAYFAIDYGSVAHTTAERIAGTPYVPNPIETSHGIIRCANRASGNERIVHYVMAGTYNSNAAYIANLRGTVFGHNQVAHMNSNRRQTFGYTDVSAHGSGSLYGLDDYQDGWSCANNWQPSAARHARLVVLVR